MGSEEAAPSPLGLSTEAPRADTRRGDASGRERRGRRTQCMLSPRLKPTQAVLRQMLVNDSV